MNCSECDPGFILSKGDLDKAPVCHLIFAYSIPYFRFLKINLEVL